MRLNRLALLSLTALLPLVCESIACSDASKPAGPAAVSSASSATTPTFRTPPTAPRVRVLSRNARGSARMLAGALDADSSLAAMNSGAAARLHLQRHSYLLDVSKHVIEDAVLTDVNPLPSGAGVFRFAQRVDGIEVFGGRASVVLDGSRRLVAIANGLVPADRNSSVKSATGFANTSESALSRAYELMTGTPVAVSAVKDAGPRGGDAHAYTVSTARDAMRVLEATAKRIFYPQTGGLRPAYYLEILGRDPDSKVDRAMAYAIDAQDGLALYQASLTHNEAFGYRVWADPAGNHIPTDGPFVDSTPSTTTGNMQPAYAAPSLIMMEGFNKNPSGKADPWLSPTDTVSFGNNVRAYSDRNDTVAASGAHRNDGYNAAVDVRADVTSSLMFDRTYDVTKAPNASSDQIKAAVTQLFYVTNWMHDYWYDSGFDEKSGVAQLSNFGRGGLDGDPLLAEAQDEADSGVTNNASMSILNDGTSPRMQMFVWSGSPLRDGTIDNTVVAHEWGHYLHHRLVLCGSPQCNGMSEGWGDFNALMMVIKDGDRFDGGQVYPIAQYATSGLAGTTAASNVYFGIRRAPYSTDLGKNPFTLKHVRRAASLPSGAPLGRTGGEMSEAHNAGEIWAVTLFESYVNLLAVGKAANRSFEETKRRMADYVVAGMKAAPTEPTFIEQRDAILSAVLATGRYDDFSAIAQGFAKRGLGVGAIAAPVSSRTLNETVEDFQSNGNLSLVDASIDDSTHSCDQDGYLDAAESGKVNIRVRNGGWLTLTKTQVQVSSNDPQIVLDGGGLATGPAIAPYQVVPFSIGVSASNAVMGRRAIPITVTISDPDAASPTSTSTFSTIVNLDDEPGVATIDDVESQFPAFVSTHVGMPLPIDVWSRKPDGGTGHFWHGDDTGATGDEALVSPTLAVSTSSAFTITFNHRYEFESGPPAPNRADVYFDGGVIELSDDDGASWKDISTYASTPYTRTIFSSDDQGGPNSNPLAGRKAFGGDSADYPMMGTVSLDLGMKLSGKMVKIRFRIGTDGGAGAAGWDIDDIAFGGVTNAPFAALVDNATPACAPITPSPNAGGGGGGGLVQAGDGGNATGGRAAVTPLGGAAPTLNADGSEPAAATPSESGCSCSSVTSPPAGPYGSALGMLGMLGLVLRRRRRLPGGATVNAA